MSNYYVIDDMGDIDDTDYIKYNYHILYDVRQIDRFNKVLKELIKNWDNTIIHLKCMYDYDIDINELMKRLTKIYFLNYRTSKKYMKEKRIAKNDRLYKIKQLNKLRTININK